VFGAGKVGAGLTRALRAVGWKVALRPQRRGLPRRIDADLVVLAIRDRDLTACAEALTAGAVLVRRPVAVVHCAGALGPEPLAVLRAPGVTVAQMHPMISFASPRRTPSLVRGQLHVDGDAPAMAAARRLGRALGMTPRTVEGLDRVAYHAAAGLVANGAAALAAGGLELLETAGVARPEAVAMVGPLLRSVADNIEALGLPDALTGPVRRGEAAAVGRHLETLRRLAPHLVPFYVAAGLAQLPHARGLAEAPPEALEEIERVLTAG
jgi:predicted short-subunit dehydrogenase-like oxidoreductase (DUF2520 family)